jgi:hypothetical protein
VDVRHDDEEPFLVAHGHETVAGAIPHALTVRIPVPKVHGLVLRAGRIGARAVANAAGFRSRGGRGRAASARVGDRRRAGCRLP